MSWLNNDGLELKFGTEKAATNPQGEYRYNGPVRVAEINFDFTQLPTVAENSVIVGDNLILPVGAVVERVEIANHTDFASAANAMTLNVGWIDTDRTSNVDVDAFVVAATQTEINTGGTNVAGWVGAGVNVPLTTAKLITWQVGTAAATAGTGMIRLYYSMHA